MTFDCVDELEKIADECPSALLVLRIKSDDPSAVVQFGHKYGADPDTQAPALLEAAKRLRLSVIGVSFHVGSGSQSPDAYSAAIESSRRVFDTAKGLGFEMRLLDLGGGFMGRFAVGGGVKLKSVAEAINAALAQFFPPGGGVCVIAEPGRYFAEACATMYALVHTVKSMPGASTGPDHRSYFITDGVYGSFNGIIYDHGSVTSKVLRDPLRPDPTVLERTARTLSTVFGPTCDGVDLIYKDVPMPLLRRGDWLQFPNFGAYSIAGACAFNGLPVDAPQTYYVWSHEPVGRLERRVRILQRRGEGDEADAPEEELCFVGDLHDLDSIC